MDGMTHSTPQESAEYSFLEFLCLFLVVFCFSMWYVPPAIVAIVSAPLTIIGFAQNFAIILVFAFVCYLFKPNSKNKSQVRP